MRYAAPLAAILAFFIPSAHGQMLRSDSDARYVHRLTLYDHDGRAIDPAAPNAAPYSPRATCGKCHDYTSISHGWHFSAASGGASTRVGQPWIFADSRIGTQIPLAERNWPGAYSAFQVGLSPRQFVKQFGRHLPGGGIGEPDDATRKSGQEAVRWSISGALEIDCMMCHSSGTEHDPAEMARQVEAENFKWAPTAAAGLGTVRGEARKLPEDFDPDAPPSPDHPDRALPTIVYNKSRFDADNRVLFNVTREPPAERCLFCHTNRAVGAAAEPHWLSDGDVHLAAGMTCTACHRNGIDHRMLRGDGRTVGNEPEWAAAAFSCSGCHLGTDSPANSANSGSTSTSAPASAPAASSSVTNAVAPGTTPRGNFAAAPRPVHAGLPPIHLEVLTCTACHSGPYPAQRTTDVQTSRAHALGIGSKTRGAADWPRIVEPVFAETPDRKLAPHRLIWPSFFAKQAGAQLVPLPLEMVRKAFPNQAAAPTSKPAERETFLAPETIRAVLGKLAADAKPAVGEQIVYLTDGRIWSLDPQGALKGDTDSKVRLQENCYLWPLAHDVRPASQALGARGCTDCHRESNPIQTAIVLGDLADQFQSGQPGGRIFALSDANALRPHLELPMPDLTFKPLMLVVGWLGCGFLLLAIVARAVDVMQRTARR